ncbi:MAG: hypothetical protein WD696_18645 [Bryobacteraceae bacterium]
MIAFLELPTVATLGYLCAAAGFLVIVASVVFIGKGKAVLSESGAPNEIAWGKMRATLTSAVALFVLGAAMIALPFWRFQEAEARQQEARAQQPTTALLTGKITGPGGRNVRLLLVVKPDYDQTYSGDIVWEFPLVAQRASYSVFYVDGDTIIGQRSFSVEGANAGSPLQKVALPVLDLQTGNPKAAAAQEITPKREVSDAELKELGIY